MGWQSEDGQHEGWVAEMFDDGGLGSGAGPMSDGRPGILVARIGDRYLAHDDWQFRPPEQVTGWVAACVCGWRGRSWRRVADADSEDLAAGRAYSADGWAGESDGMEDLAWRDYRRHLAPDEALAAVAELTGQVNVGEQQLDAAVATARAAGASWEAIGRATGITRQSAHERWRDVAAGDAGARTGRRGRRPAAVPVAPAELPELVIAAHFALDGPYDDEHTIAAARLASELVRYLNRATRHPAAASWPGAIDRVIGGLSDAAYGLQQTYSQLATRLTQTTADPAAYLAQPVGEATTPQQAGLAAAADLAQAGSAAAAQCEALSAAQAFTAQLGVYDPGDEPSSTSSETR